MSKNYIRHLTSRLTLLNSSQKAGCPCTKPHTDSFSLLKVTKMYKAMAVSFLLFFSFVFLVLKESSRVAPRFAQKIKHLP